MMTLFDNPFSPFARKVRMVLEHKAIPFSSVDALALDRQEELRAISPRAEVPVLAIDDLIIVDSADIVAYLEDTHPNPSLWPAGPALRAKARRWQRMADRTFDAIIHDISLWVWPTLERVDSPPVGLLEAGREDLGTLLDELDEDLGDGDFVCGELSIADFALFPHISSLPFVGMKLDELRHPRVRAWQRRMRGLDAVIRDLDHTREAVAEKFGGGASGYEADVVVWRGDRIEWLLTRGFDDWWTAERTSGRAVVPSSIPAARIGD